MFTEIYSVLSIASTRRDSPSDQIDLYSILFAYLNNFLFACI